MVRGDVIFFAAKRIIAVRLLYIHYGLPAIRTLIPGPRDSGGTFVI